LIAIILGAIVCSGCDDHKDNNGMATAACALGILSVVLLIVMILLLALGLIVGGVTVASYHSSFNPPSLWRIRVRRFDDNVLKSVNLTKFGDKIDFNNLTAFESGDSEPIASAWKSASGDSDPITSDDKINNSNQIAFASGNKIPLDSADKTASAQKTASEDKTTSAQKTASED